VLAAMLVLGATYYFFVHRQMKSTTASIAHDSRP